MKRTVVMLLLCCLLPAVTAQTKADRRGKELLRLENEWREAQRVNDRAAFDRLLSPDLTFVGTSGSFRDKTGFIASRGSSWIPRAETYTYAEISVRFYGETAIVTGLEATTGAGVTARARFTHVWAKTKGKWLLVAIQRTEIISNP
jgi:ketosteroid isomerase-like protein